MCVCAWCLYVCVCVRGREIDKREKDKEKKEGKKAEKKNKEHGKNSASHVWVQTKCKMEKKITASANWIKSSLQDTYKLFPRQWHTQHTTHTSFHLLTPSFSFILPSLALFFFQRLANVSVRACVQLPRDHKGGTVSWRKRVHSPLLSGSSLFSRISFASVPSSIRSSLVITPMVLEPVVSHGTENNINTNMQKQNSITTWKCFGATAKKSQSDYVFWLFVVTDQMDAIHEVTCWMQHKPHYTILPQYKNVQWTCKIHFVNVFKCVKCVGQLPRNGKIPQNECQNSFQKIGHLWCHREDYYYYIFQVCGNKSQVLFFLTIFCFTLLCFAALTLTLNN